jgi:single-strand DNA-binding protein
MNRIFITGNLTRDPELKSTPSGKSVCSFSVANNREWTGSDGQKQKKTSFFNCISWGKNGEAISKFFQKGRKILVMGSMESRDYEKDGQKRTVWECNVDGFEFMDSNKAADPKPEPSQPDHGDDAESSSDIPF